MTRLALLLLLLGLLVSSAGTAVGQTTASVSVNASTSLATVPPAGYGTDTAVYDNNFTPSGLPAVLKAAGINALRFPGGSYADMYHWENGGTSTGGTILGPIYINANDTFDNFMTDDVIPTGAQAVITVNYGTNAAGTAGGDPNEAAAWVKYANITHGYGIKYWEIGNEIGGNGYYGDPGWEADLHYPYYNGTRAGQPSLSPAAYGTNALAFISAMKAVDPTIKCGIGANFPDNDNPPYNAQTLAACGSKIDFVIVHYYPGGSIAQGLADPSSEITQWMQQLRAQINQYCGANAPNVQILITETNDLYGDQAPCSLFDTDDFLTWFENGAQNVDLQEMHSGLLSEGVSGLPDDTPMASYWGIAMASTAARPGDVLVSTASSNSLLVTHAVRRTDGKVAVVLLNEDPSNTCTVTVNVGNASLGNTGTRYDFGQANFTGTSPYTTTGPVMSTMTNVGNTFTTTVPPYTESDILIPLAASATTSASATVNASTSLGTIPPDNFGINAAIWDGNMFDSTVPALLNQMGARTLRYPGGSASDGYFWEQHVTSSTTGTNPADFDNFITGLSQPSGSDPIITVNYGSNSAGTGGGSPAEAAAWVQYANVTHKYGVKYWEIGNEVYGGWEEDLWPAADDAVTNPTFYGQEVVQYIDAMKAQDPTIKVGAVLQTPGNSASIAWNNAVLAQCGSVIDFVIIHWYPEYTGYTVATNTLNSNDNDAQLLQDPSTYIPGYIAGVKASITANCGANAANVKIFADENNSDAGYELYQMVDLVNGLYAADTVQTWLEQGVYNVDWWDLHNGSNVLNAAVLGDLSAQGISLYSQPFGTSFGDESVLSVGGGNEPPAETPFSPYYGFQMLTELGKPGDTMNPATSTSALLGVHAVTNANGNLSVMLINRDPNNSTTAYVGTPGFVPSGQVAQFQYAPGDNPSVQSTSPTATVASDGFIITVPPYSLTTVVLSGSTGGSEFTSSATATPSPANPGTPVDITATFTDTGALVGSSTAVISIYNSVGTLVSQQSLPISFLETNTPVSVSAPFTTSAPDTYTVAIGLLPNGSAIPYVWNADAATFTVSGSPAFALTAAAPASVNAGAPLAITATFTDTGAPVVNGIADIQVFNSTGTSVYQQYFSETFAYDTPVTLKITTPAPLTPGTYYVELGAFNSSWSVNYAWNGDAATVSVSAGVVRTVTASAGANGSISPSGSVSVATGASQTFTATPSTGYQVNQWTLDGVVAQDGGSTYSLVNVQANHAIGVTFSPAPSNLVVNGTYYLTNVNSGLVLEAPGASKTEGVQLDQHANSGSTGQQWTLNNLGNNLVSLINVNSNMAVDVSGWSGAGGGIIDQWPYGSQANQQWTIHSAGNGYYYLIADNSGLALEVAGSSTANGGLIDQNAYVGGANQQWSFTGAAGGTKYTVTGAVTGAGGAVAPASAAVTSGGSETFTATPSAGYNVAEWYVDGAAVQAGGTAYTVYNVQASHAVTVTFTPPSYTVTGGVTGEGGTISPASSVVTFGGSQLFTATAAAGYQVATWFVDGASVQTGGATYTLPSVEATHAVTVTFSPVTYSLTATVSGPQRGFLVGTVSPTAATVAYGGSQTFTAVPTTGLQVVNWSLDGTVVQTGGSTFTVTNIVSSHAIVVTFAFIPYTVTGTVSGTGGTISPTTATVNYGGSQTFTATPNTGYQVGVWSLNGTAVQTGGLTYTDANVQNNDSITVTFTATTITPSVPSNVTATAGVQQITVGWSASVNATGYQLERSATAVGGYSVIATIPSTSATTYSYTDTGRLVGKTYYYYVVATNSTYGTSSAASATVSAVPTAPVPGLPTNVTATAGVSSITVSWSASANSTDYELERSATAIGGYSLVTTVTATSATTYSYTDTGRIVGKTYYYEVIAQNTTYGTTSGPTAPVSAVPVSQYTVTVSAGAGGTVSPMGSVLVSPGGSVTVTATPNTGYQVAQWSLDGTAVQTGGSTYTLSTVEANHSVAVTFTPITYTLTGTVTGTGGTISPATATVNYGGSQTFTATPNTGYQVGAWFLDGGTIPVQTGGSTYTLANVLAGHSVSVTFTLLSYTLTGTVTGTGGTISPANATVNYGGSQTFTATPNTGYQVAQWSLNGTAVQTGGASYTDTNVQNNDSITVSFTVLSTTPTVPSNVSAVAGAQQITVSWSASVNATGYQLERSATAVGGYSVVATIPSTSATSYSYTDTGRLVGKTYYYYVVATNSTYGTSSGPSSTVSAVPTAPVPAVPGGFTAVPGSKQVTLSWNASANATEYELERSATAVGGYSVVATIPGTSATSYSYTDTGRITGKTYYYVVIALNTTYGTTSGPSAPISAIPL